MNAVFNKLKFWKFKDVDPNVTEAKELLQSRSEFGVKKYKGKTTSDLTLQQSVRHAIEEAADELLYLIQMEKELVKLSDSEREHLNRYSLALFEQHKQHQAEVAGLKKKISLLEAEAATKGPYILGKKHDKHHVKY
jgi:hypothetical protein